MHMNWLEISIGIVFLICNHNGTGSEVQSGLWYQLIATIVTFVIDFLCNAVCVSGSREIYAAG